MTFFNRIIFVAVLVLFVIPAKTQNLLLAPVRQTRDTLASITTRCGQDKQFCTASYLLIGSFVSDEISTHEAFKACQSCDERGWFDTGSRNTPVIALENFGYDWAFLEAGYELRRSHNRYIRAAGIAPLAIQTYVHLRFGLANNLGMIHRYGNGE